MAEEAEDSLAPGLTITRLTAEGNYIYLLEITVENRSINARSECWGEFREYAKNTVNIWFEYDLYPKGETITRKDVLLTIRCNPKGLPGFILVCIYDESCSNGPGGGDPPASGRSIIRFEKAKPVDVTC